MNIPTEHSELNIPQLCNYVITSSLFQHFIKKCREFWKAVLSRETRWVLRYFREREPRWGSEASLLESISLCLSIQCMTHAASRTATASVIPLRSMRCQSSSLFTTGSRPYGVCAVPRRALGKERQTWHTASQCSAGILRWQRQKGAFEEWTLSYSQHC